MAANVAAETESHQLPATRCPAVTRSKSKLCSDSDNADTSFDTAPAPVAVKSEKVFLENLLHFREASAPASAEAAGMDGLCDSAYSCQMLPQSVRSPPEHSLLVHSDFIPEIFICSFILQYSTHEGRKASAVDTYPSWM